MKISNTLILILCLICLESCAKPESKLNGNVFIVTKSRDNIKLGLVSVMLFEKKTFDVSAALIQANTLKKIEQTKDKLDTMFQEEKTLRKIYLDQNDAESATNLQREAESLNWNWKLGEMISYLTNLPPPLLTAKTDADGKFKFVVPSGGDFVIVA